MQAQKGVRIKGVTVKAVPKGSLPPPPESLQTDITAVVPQMFAPKKKVVSGIKLKLQKPGSVQPLPIKPSVPLQPSLLQPQPTLLEKVIEANIESARNDEETETETQPQETPEAEDEKNEVPPTVTVPAGDEGVSPELVSLQAAVVNKEKTDIYTLKKDEVYVPESSRAFSKFIMTSFSDFSLPPRLGPLNFDACSTMELKTYKYQEFIREYMRSASPYRGTLVYHGLGSGKTCTAIATAEALYGTSDKKIIVMTPISLQENFINEISFCGFQHFRLQNHWIPFSLTDPAQRLFAKEVVGIPDTHVRSVIRKSKEEDKVFWMPDFTKESNYESLTDSQQTAIRLQIRAIIQSRIIFIGYTGITHDTLKQIACDKPDFFDDAVIIIDEVHNLTRLMRGKLDPYLKNVRASGPQAAPQPGKKPKKIPFSYEPVTTEVWKPKLCGSSQKYNRAFLFYRLLAQAKRSKIIALSGTPIVNFPEEVGILCNILHGYFHSVEDVLQSIQNEDILALEKILKLHPRIQYYSLKKAEGYTTVFFTRLEEGYKKVFVGESLQGIVNVGEDATPNTIQEIYQDILQQTKDASLKFGSRPVFSAIPLFPETIDDFNSYFVDTTSLHIKNPLLFTKRVSGLISYYKGAKEELMPKVVKDEIVFCPMSAYALVPYAEARQKEREEKQKKSTSTWDELQALASESSSASYRFRSRAACNFVFPKGIPRPFPSNKRDFKESAEVENNILGDNDADAVEDDAASQAIIEEEEQDAIEDGEEQEQQGQIKEIPTDNMRIPYKDRIRLAIEGLRSVASNRFKLSTSAPQDEQLANYSGKFVEILSRIQASPGSSLVYSQFKTLEGIGVFSIVLDSNGYAPLKLMGPDDDLYFAPETEHSLRNNPTQPRYIIYSGEESKRVRQTLINVFNTKVSSLPPKILNVLNDSGLLDPVTRKGNFKGEICKVFMITGAGAEGLSLRNVRTVHIMEPYWNTVRTDQVKGRAVRICSHSDLPYDPDPAKNQRTVEVFTYISKISDAMKKARTIDQTLITMDEGITTDEHILSISREKEQLGQDFLKAMKEGAVDCVLNQTENEAISCFVYDGKVGDFMYDPRIREDKDISDRELIAAPKLVAKAPGETTTTTNQQQGPQTQKATIVTWQKKQYFLIDRKDASGDYKGVFDISDRGFIKELGRLATDSTGKKRLQFYA